MLATLLRVPVPATTRCCNTSQETALSKLAASRKRAEILKKEASAVRGFVKKHIEPMSMALDQLIGAASFKASLSQPIKDLKAAGDVGTREAAAAASSAQSDVDTNTAIVDSIAAEEEARRAATEAVAKAEAATAKRKALEADAAAGATKKSRGGGGGGGDACKLYWLGVVDVTLGHGLEDRRRCVTC